MLPRSKGPVAEWVFKDSILPMLTWDSLQNSLVTCERTISILRAHELLSPNVIRFSQWMKAGEYGVFQSKRVDKSDVVISISPSTSHAELLMACRLIFDEEHVYPLTIEVDGVGTIVSDQGEFLVEDLVWLRVSVLDTFNLSIGTQSDVWLPFTLSGHSQSDIYVRNSDRLAEALLQVQRETGFDLEEGAESQYSVIVGFRLDNVRYFDGSVADVS
ncbi:MAG: hypothetical protein JWQ98_1121 [Chlorobi bacterium]|nr:hypothetical protein [Chlorobiota bacterium]